MKDIQQLLQPDSAMSRFLSEVHFVVPNAAMSAGTIFCMSGDKIYMDYSSSLGPIDPQVPAHDGRLVPALGYIDKVNEFIEKAHCNSGLSGSGFYA